VTPTTIYHSSFPTRRSSDLVIGTSADAVIRHGHQGQRRRRKSVVDIPICASVVSSSAVYGAIGRIVDQGRNPRDDKLAPEIGSEDRKSTRLNSSHQIISYAV